MFVEAYLVEVAAQVIPPLLATLLIHGTKGHLLLEVVEEPESSRSSGGETLNDFRCTLTSINVSNFRLNCRERKQTGTRSLPSLSKNIMSSS